MKLTNSLFMVADETKKGALDPRIMIANMIFWLKGDSGIKWAFFFDIFSQTDNQGGSFGVYVPNIVKVLTDALKCFKESFYLAKTALDRMNTSLNGQISQQEFMAFCRYNPQAIDFVSRLTLGPYPPSDEILAQMKIHLQASQMQSQAIV